MNILRRGFPAAETNCQKSPADPVVTRRVTVTVERETVTVRMRNRPDQAAPELLTTSGESACAEVPEFGPPELPPPAPAREESKKDRP
jgi:hypothetical protein